MIDKKRLIEVAFPLKQTSLDSVHEKNVRHGHISTLHIWPARRPLAACRAALIATLLPDPGNAEERNKILERLAGRVVPTVKKKKMPNGKVEEIEAEETVGGILHWGRESGPDLEWFREEIRKAYGGRAPRVLDPFAGGGAIPLEAMRLGCEVTAIDINPVAWFILKCTLEYPQKLAGKMLRLPAFILADREFMKQYFEKAVGLKGAALRRRFEEHFLEADRQRQLPVAMEDVVSYESDLDADLAWHVRAWGRWVLNEARKELAEFYPTYASWEPALKKDNGKLPKNWMARWKKEHSEEIATKGLKLCPLRPNGTVDETALNSEFQPNYLADPQNPRWVPKPTVAYLWARTVKNKHHPETIIPLLKTRWLCKKDDKRVLLTMHPKADGTGVEFGIQTEVPKVGGNTAQRREHDKRLGAGTMSGSGVTCPVQGNILTKEDIQLEGRAGRLGTVLSAVVVNGQQGKEYRLPTSVEIQRAEEAGQSVQATFQGIPFGLPTETVPVGASRVSGGSAFTVSLFGFDEWQDLFTQRQLLSHGVFLGTMRRALTDGKVDGAWRLATGAHLYCAFSRLLDRNSQLCTWQLGAEKIGHTFARYALPMTWDFVEVMPWADSSGGFHQAVEWIAQVCEHTQRAVGASPPPSVTRHSAIQELGQEFDIIVTDPPYYDAIPYSDLMDFFYIWGRRLLWELHADTGTNFNDALSPKWNHEEGDGELIDDSSRFGGDGHKSKLNYESGMRKAFTACYRSLCSEGRLVIVFANKHPDAWETLVSATINAGFVVDGSWPIQTERVGRMRSLGSAALASSVWLVCKKRNPASRPGWDNTVLEQMREKISTRLRDFWDAGIRGPDFVWAATGPALEAYSQYPVVKKANKPGELMTVSEFLRHVRRMVLDFVVGQVLSKATGGEAATEELDDVTTYYLLHRNDFKMSDAPAGACILYAVSCNLSDRDLVDAFDLLVPSGGTSSDDEESDGEDDGEEMAEGSSSTFKLKPWNKRKRQGMGYDRLVDSPAAHSDAKQGRLFTDDEPAGPRTRIVPLIDQIHRLMHHWKTGDVVKVDEYLNLKSLRSNAIFPQVLQALIEMSDVASEERSILESLSNHVQGRSVRAAYTPTLFANE